MELFASPGISSLLARIGRFLAEEGIRAYLVGGFVRDLLLKRETADIDIAVDADALKTAARLADYLEGKYVLLDEANSIARVVLPEETSPTKAKMELDFSKLRGNIENDLAQRDFTIDAMAIELDAENAFPLSRLIDPFGGQNDLHHGVIRAVSDTVFQSDAARLLRAVRLAAGFGFSIESHTEALIRQNCQLVAYVAGERTREELLRLLSLPCSGEYLSYLDDLGLLTSIIPELEPAKGVSQPFIHFWDVFDHSLQTVAAIEFLLRQGTWQYAGKDVLEVVPWSAALSQHFIQEVSSGSTLLSLLKLAALLHDIAKPQTKSLDTDGRARFLGHPTEGATTATGILERLRFSTREIKMVELMVQHHLRPSQTSQDELPSRRAIYRYFRDVGEAAIETLFLNLADHLATRGPMLDMTQWKQHTQIVSYLLEEHAKEETTVPTPRLIDGHDLINVLGLTPGPEMGVLLEAVCEAQAAGEVTTKEEALEYTKRLLEHPEDISLNNVVRGNHE